jgi:cytochrome P450
VALHYLRDSFAYYLECRDRYGDPFTLPTPWGKLVVTGRPKGIETIFSAPPDGFGIFARTVVEPFLGPTSLMLSSGEIHLRNRRLLSPRFNSQHSRIYVDAIAEVTTEAVDGWRTGNSLVAQRAMHAITLEIILRVFFGARDERKHTLRQALIDVQRAMGPEIAFLTFIRHEFGGLGPWARFQRAMRSLDGVVQEMIDDARAHGHSDDMLGMFVSLGNEADGGYSDIEIRDELVSLVYAGHETLAGSLGWALYWIHRDAEVEQRLRQEVEAVPTDASAASFLALPYLEAVCYETLRLGPVVPEVTRFLKVPLELLGYSLPAGVTVAPSILLAHQDETLYANPREFRPERFLERKYSPFEFLPFGGGTHRCLGASLAVHEMKIVLATVLRRCRLRLVEQGVVRPIRRGVLIGPNDNVALVVTEVVPKGHPGAVLT